MNVAVPVVFCFDLICIHLGYWTGHILLKQCIVMYNTIIDNDDFKIHFRVSPEG